MKKINFGSNYLALNHTNMAEFQKSDIQIIYIF